MDGHCGETTGERIARDGKPAKQWAPPFSAVLFNEAGEPHHEIELTVCGETAAFKGSLYRLIEFSRDGAAYKWFAFASIPQK